MRVFRCYLLLLVACTIAVVLTAMIPHRTIESHCQTSIAYIVKQGEYPSAYGLPFLKTDNFTDLLMLNEAWCSDDTQPINASMMNYFFLTNDDNLFKASWQLITQPTEQPQLQEYSRYWHGFQIVLRPLLVLTDYSNLIIVNYILLILVALWCLYEVWWQCSPMDCILLALVLLLTAFYAVPLCFQYSVCFYIMFFSVITLLQNKKHMNRNKEHEVCSFFTIGALTAFFDLLTTPLLTLGIPLLLYLRSKEQRSRTTGLAVRLSIAWGMGYAVLWLSKCLVAWLLTGHNILNFFMKGVYTRSALGLGSINSLIMTHPIICVAILVILIVIILLVTTHIPFLRQHGWHLFIAVMPFLWYAVLLQHSIIHFFFVWRILAITVLSLMMLGRELVTARDTRKNYI